MPELMKGLGVEYPGNAVMKWQQFERWGMHNVEYGNRKRELLTISKPVGAIALLAAMAIAVGFGLNKWHED